MTTMDNGTPFVLEKLTRGAIIGSHMMLVADENKVTATCVTACQIFTIDRKRFTELVVRDPQLLNDLLERVKQQIALPAIDLTLDFVFVKDRIELHNGEVIEGEEAMRASKLSQKLKNIIMLVIIKNRETRKVPKLKDILNDAILRQQKEQAAKRKDRERSKDITKLLSESLKPHMNEGQYEMVNEQIAKVRKTFD